LRVLDALAELTSSTKKHDSKLPIVLIGHDRGARVAHALQISPIVTNSAPSFRVVGLALLDIVPTLYQWENATSAASQTGFFHWSFLATIHISKPMILAYGGGKWALDMIYRWRGTNSSGVVKMESGDALAVWKHFFDQESVIEASGRDYESGAKEDLDLETKSLAEGKGIKVPLLLVYSQDFLTKRAKKPIKEVWGPPWTVSTELITERPVGNGIGHFVAEEAPEETAKSLVEWLEGLQSTKH
jgi:pimeloyl-ACP methyl ester carboxylesterase